MRLAELLPEATFDAGIAAIEATGVTSDSRRVEPGFLFVAIAGVKADGAQFAVKAAQAGAVAVAGERKPDGLPGSVAFIQVSNARRALALAASKFFFASAATYRCSHRHQRQDIGRRLHA